MITFRNDGFLPQVGTQAHYRSITPTYSDFEILLSSSLGSLRDLGPPPASLRRASDRHARL
jgi:hypothetical protein